MPAFPSPSTPCCPLLQAEEAKKAAEEAERKKKEAELEAMRREAAEVRDGMREGLRWKARIQVAGGSWGGV